MGFYDGKNAYAKTWMAAVHLSTLNMDFVFCNDYLGGKHVHGCLASTGHFPLVHITTYTHSVPSTQIQLQNLVLGQKTETNQAMHILAMAMHILAMDPTKTGTSGAVLDWDSYVALSYTFPD